MIVFWQTFPHCAVVVYVNSVYCQYATVWKLRKFSLTLFWQKFRESNVILNGRFHEKYFLCVMLNAFNSRARNIWATDTVPSFFFFFNIIKILTPCTIFQCQTYSSTCLMRNCKLSTFQIKKRYYVVCFVYAFLRLLWRDLGKADPIWSLW